jgi:hypothetical protein
MDAKLKAGATASLSLLLENYGRIPYTSTCES